MKPRKHAELIKAWADGCVIQTREKYSGDWQDLEVPGWHDHVEYRIKPEKTVIRYRRYVWSECGVPIVQTLPCFCAYKSPLSLELLPNFIRWIDTEWQEVEV